MTFVIGIKGENGIYFATSILKSRFLDFGKEVGQSDLFFKNLVFEVLRQRFQWPLNKPKWNHKSPNLDFLT